MEYEGSCHCGQVKFAVEGEISSVTSCNCSMCQRKGVLLWFVPRSAMTLLTPDEDARTYVFNKHVIKHRFCATCGVHPFGEGKDPAGNDIAAINARCIDGLDLAAIPVKHHDGRSL